MKKAVDEVIENIFILLKDKQIINNNECNLPCILFYEKDDIVHKHSLTVDSKFTFCLERFGYFCFDFNIEKIAFILDITYRKIPTKKESIKEDIKKFIENLDETEDPSLYPPSLRSDAFITYFFNFKNEKAIEIITYPYTIQDQKIIRLEKEEIQPLYSPDSNNYIKHILKGFMNKYIYDHLNQKIRINMGTYTYEQFIQHVDKVKEDYPGLKALI